MRRTAKHKMAEGVIPAHPYLVRQMSDFGFRQTLKVQTLGSTRRSPFYQLTSRRLAKDLGYPKNDTRDAGFILVQATMVV